MPERPGPEVQGEGRDAWLKRVHAYNGWLRTARRHNVGVAIDKLRAVPSADMSPADLIALTLGMDWLENSDSPINIFLPFL